MKTGNLKNVGMEANRETVNLKELAYMRRRAVEGRSTRSTSSRVVTSRAHHRQASYQLQNDNKSLDFVYYSDSEDEAVDGNGIFVKKSDEMILTSSRAASRRIILRHLMQLCGLSREQVNMEVKQLTTCHLE